MKSILAAKEKAKQLAKSKNLKLKDALNLLGKENGFEDWKSYKDSIDTFWYEKSSPFLNHWFAKYSEAKEFQKKEGGYLLTFKGQYFVASKDYVEHLGINSEDPVWESIDYDISSSSSIDKFLKYYQGKI